MPPCLPCTLATPGAALPLVQAYEKLCTKLKEVDALNGISGLLGW